MKMSLVFAPDPDLGPDPGDPAKEARSIGVFIDTDKEDVLLVHRRYGEQFQGGKRDDIYGSGVFENLPARQLTQALAWLEGLPDDEILGLP